MTWEELKNLKSGTILKDWYDGEVRCLILRGPVILCAYIGVSIGSPFAGKHYSEIDLDCHGGLTFSGKGDGKYRPKGWWWYGWDYGHLGDSVFYDSVFEQDNQQWLVEDVEREIKQAIEQFKHLMSLAENKGG